MGLEEVELVTVGSLTEHPGDSAWILFTETNVRM